MHSFIRWAGSKRQALGELRRHWIGEPARYIEPFAGSASLFFDVGPRRAILADLNGELIGTLRAVQRDVYRVLECFHRLPKGKDAYYRVRCISPEDLCEFEAAARFIYLNRYCFNGLYRTNQEGQFNVPYGPPKRGVPLDENAIIQASTILKNALLVAGDFENTLALARTGDFVYLDPPYVTSKRRIFREYLPGSFGPADLERLGRVLCELNSRNITFVITYADTPEARKLLRSWNPRRIRIRRNIAGFTGSRRQHYELLATNSPLGAMRDAD